MDLLKGIILLGSVLLSSTLPADQLEFILVEINDADVCRQASTDSAIPQHKSAKLISTGKLKVQPDQSFRLLRKVQENHLRISGKLEAVKDNPQQKWLNVLAHVTKANKDANEVSTQITISYDQPILIAGACRSDEPGNTVLSELWYVKLSAT
ncbi:hypothetical protein [Spartinivicinus ruber]|uniref:hypothetical protein n=1 Tax=Spartinivicinus ruber TaxID=2683272 RepID=UPI0013D19B1D|nr:hypothetical protein [Spartinivicinus ruber]